MCDKTIFVLGNFNKKAYINFHMDLAAQYETMTSVGHHLIKFFKL